MSKLEKKLNELDYYHFTYTTYHKRFNSSQIFICINDGGNSIRDYYVKSFIENEKDLIDSKLAYELMQKDLEVLKQYQD